MNDRAERPLSILRIVTDIGETSGSYNEFSLPLRHRQRIAFCSYFRSKVSVPDDIVLFEGDGSLRGFFRALRAALTATEYDIIHVHIVPVALPFLVANVILRKSMKRTVFSVNDSYQNFKLRNRLILILVFALFRRLVFCGRSSLESFPFLFRWLAGGRLSVTPNAVDLDRVDRVLRRVGEHRGTDRFRIAVVGRVIEIKNPRTVLRALQLCADRNVRLVFVGEGLLRPALTAECRTAGLQDLVEFTGLIPRERVYEELTTADLFISASHGEGIPVAVLEAMACRCPVVLSNILPHAEIADNSDFIPLLPANDAAAFAREIKRFRDMPVAARTEIGRRCRQLVEQRFSLPVMHAGYDAVYSEITGGLSSPGSSMGLRVTERRS